jgi:type IV secretory pathway TraG/TraD family ATPase VirD4
MSGAGKTTLLISQIALWVGSCFIIDPKGQITRALSEKDSREWFIFCPEHKFGYKSACINVFDLLEALHESGDIGAFVNWSHQIALAIIPAPGENIRSPYFYQTPCGFLMGLIIHVYTSHPKEEWNLPFLRDLIKFGYPVYDEKTGREISSKDEALKLLFVAMRNNPVIAGIVPGAAAAFMSASNETLANLNSTLFTETIWLDNPSIRAVLIESSFDLRDLKRRDDVVFSMVAGILAIRGPFKNLFRFIINITALCFEHFDEKKGQCLMVADELPSMGNNPIIEILLPVFRSYGITFVGISQDIQLLIQAYAKVWRSFIGNADFVVWMASNERETKEYCSAELGQREITEVDRVTGHKSKKIVDVLSPEQVGRVLEPDAGRMIVTYAGQRPRIVADGPYYKTLSVGQYDPDPEHGDSFLRSIGRFIFDRKSTKENVEENIHTTNENQSYAEEELAHDKLQTNIIKFEKPGRPNP